jgi:molybdopterin molybdotransferase
MAAAKHLAEQFQGPSCCETTGERLIPVDIALEKGLALAAPPATIEHLPLMAARGRILAAPAVAPAPMPAFDNSAMDGYAVRTADLTGDAPHPLALAGRVAAGDGWAEADRAPGGSALRILTGAPVPPSFDAVVMQERARREGDRVELLDTPRPGLNIRRAGEDAETGAALLEPGRLIGARQLAVLAATARCLCSRACGWRCSRPGRSCASQASRWPRGRSTTRTASPWPVCSTGHGST